MMDSGYIVEHYTMIHSKWSDENPVYGQRCSLIRISGSEGHWFSTNCSEELPYICMNKEDKFALKKAAGGQLASIDSSTDTATSTAAPAVKTDHHSTEIPGTCEINCLQL